MSVPYVLLACVDTNPNVCLAAGGPSGNPDVCGAMTGGGSESILTVMKACRDYARYVRGIRQPQMIIGDSAHAAYFKGAEYFKIKLVMVPVGPDYRLSGKAVQKAVTRNTILVIASAPGFPHGVIDHIEDIAQVCWLLFFSPPFSGWLGHLLLNLLRTMQDRQRLYKQPGMQRDLHAKSLVLCCLNK